jgi:hypothetical protein
MPDYPAEENYDVNTAPESCDEDDESSDSYLEEED